MYKLIRSFFKRSTYRVRKANLIGRYSKGLDLSLDLEEYVGVRNNIVFFCIGTDRSTGDSFGPLIGTLLEEKGYTNVVGTLDNPVHAVNIHERLKEVKEGSFVIAIDCSLSKNGGIGELSLRRGNLYPGSAIDKDLPGVGDYSITGIINTYTEDKYLNHQLLSTTRLSLVYRMAQEVVLGLVDYYPLEDRAFLEVVN